MLEDFMVLLSNFYTDNNTIPIMANIIPSILVYDGLSCSSHTDNKNTISTCMTANECT